MRATRSGVPRHCVRLAGLVPACALLLLACGSEPPPAPVPAPRVYYRFPWVEECKQALEQRFGAERARNADFAYELVYFSRSLNPVPSLRGYVELSGSGYDTASLAALADEVIRRCYPTTTRKIALNDRKFRARLEQTRGIARSVGARELYARLSAGHLHIYFPQRPPP